MQKATETTSVKNLLEKTRRAMLYPDQQAGVLKFEDSTGCKGMSELYVKAFEAEGLIQIIRVASVHALSF